ncbi:MAG: hypothetical protein AB8B52_07415 [Winogradskyella sp.]|uniref:hypothetical protein n=1 Tax=Winogradskyella sp. TaxID=1883156 RepID=UPI00385F67F8
METAFETQIVKTKAYNKITVIIFGILYLISTFYIFLYDKENQNIYLKFVALAIYISGIYFLFGQSFIKPKKIGTLRITKAHIAVEKNDLNKHIALEQLEHIGLNYLDYGSWATHSIYGNKNYLEITETSGDTHKFEILIKNRRHKNDLKTILRSPEFDEKFDIITMPLSRKVF